MLHLTRRNALVKKFTRDIKEAVTYQTFA